MVHWPPKTNIDDDRETKRTNATKVLARKLYHGIREGNFGVGSIRNVKPWITRV